MSVVAAAIETSLSTLVLAAVANERMRAYGLKARALDLRATTIGVAATVVGSWLAVRGAGGAATSIALALAGVAAITDLQCGYVFDRVTIAGGLALVAVAATHGKLGFALAGGGAATLALAVPWALSRARGMGLGDVKLAGVLGCALGPYDALRALWFAFAIGAFVVAACIVARGRTRGQSVPFAPFVALGVAISALSAAW